MTRIGNRAVLATALVLICKPAWAHAFGQRYDLPLPLWLYVTGAGAAVALSFVITAMFHKRDGAAPKTIDLARIPGLTWLQAGLIGKAVRGFSILLLVLLVATCFWGSPDPFKNFAPTFIWVVWWVGLAFVSALIGNLWDVANPLNALYCYGHGLLGGRDHSGAYPEWLGHWPAVFMYFAFAWMELIAEAGEQPRALGLLIVGYAILTWTGMTVYGREVWLKHGEVFTVVFGLLARFAPMAVQDGRIVLRYPSVGLLTDQPMSLSKTIFVLMLLTSVTFDGLLETPAWQSFLEWVSESRMLRSPLLFIQELVGPTGFDLLQVIKTVALIVLPMVFLVVYLLFVHLITWAGGGGVSNCRAAGWFILSLVPIAIAYHLSHYLSYLLIAGQNIIPLASDPFGWGWDLFGARAYRVDIGIVSAKMVWYVAVTAIVLGHVAAVYLAHVTALRIFPTTRQALISQIPMMILMVGYTMVSLWVLSQPIVA